MDWSNGKFNGLNSTLALIFIIEGLFIIVFNAFVFGFIQLAPQRRTQRHYCILSGSVLFEFIFGWTYFTFGIHILYLEGNYELEIPMVSRWECLNKIQDLLLLFITPEAGILSLSVAIDRLLSVFTPVKYLTFPSFYAPLLYAFSFAAVAPGYVISYIENYGTRNLLEVSAECTLLDAVSPAIFKTLRYVRILATLIGVSLYIPIGCRMFQIIKRANLKTSISSAEWRKVRQMTLSIGLITLNQLVFFTAPDIYILLDGDVRRNIVYILNLNKGVFNVFIVVFTQEDLRKFLCNKIWSNTQSRNIRRFN